MTRKQKLELTWVGKDERPRLEPRILVEDPALSYHAAERVSDSDRFDNMLIQGDNLLALKALEQEFAGKVKCVFIDPPYNTGSAFEHYDDGIEHSLWLSLIRERLELLWELLSNEGSMWITIDDHEGHYLKVLCDEIAGRRSFVTSIAWEKDKGRRSDTDISSAHDTILLYAKTRDQFKQRRNLLVRSAGQESRYRNPDNDPRGPWLQGDNSTAKSGTESARFPVTTPSGRVVTPSPGRYWVFSPQTLALALADSRVYFGRGGNSMPILKRYLSEVQEGVVPRTWWPAEEVGTNQDAKRDHLNKLLKGVEPFSTPKPEGLLNRILHIATHPGDLVLDSFLGSGTTAAVAHKMGRRWIGIELGNHAVTHCVPRLKKVVNGEDPGGITDAVDWKGGGGFRFYRLAPSLLAKDQWGNWIISKEYNPAMLAEAACKLEGFRYAPHAELFWQQGHSTERDFLYVTTQTLNATQLEWLSEQVGPERSLLILCNAWLGSASAWPNLTLKKLPNAVLGRCEFGRDDYSLQIANLPAAPERDAASEPATAPVAPRRRGRKRVTDPAQESILDTDADA